MSLLEEIAIRIENQKINNVQPAGRWEYCTPFGQANACSKFGSTTKRWGHQGQAVNTFTIRANVTATSLIHEQGNLQRGSTHPP